MITGKRLLYLILLLLPFGSILLAIHAFSVWREAKRYAAKNNMNIRYSWDLRNGPRWSVVHPAAGQYCDICGAKDEPCDAGQHS